MGKRKERRLSAKVGAGRRVKLDLFADPSGELGGLSPKDEIENDVDAKHDPELPNSPTSGSVSCSEEFTGKITIGKNPENPLSLLGQYSDDEGDDASNKAEGELHHSNQQAMESISELLEEGEIDEIEDLSSQKVGDQCRLTDSALASTSQPHDPSDDLSNKVISSDEKTLKVGEEKEDLGLLTSDIQTSGESGEVNSGWKMVLHEESNRYYYWNTITGETSWEVPEGLTQGTASTDSLDSSKKDVQNVSGDAYNATAFGVGVDEFSAVQGLGYINGVSQMNMVPESESFFEQSRNDTSQFLGIPLVDGTAPCETSTLAHYNLPEQYNGSVGNVTQGSYVFHGHSSVSSEQSQNLPSDLVKQSEILLENLKFLLGSETDTGRHVLFTRYISEIGLRLSDIRALVPYGPSLMPFWMHTKEQLNQIENYINTEIGKPGMKISVESMISSEVNNVQPEGRDDDTKTVTTSRVTNDEDASVETLKSSHGNESNDGITRSHFDMEGGTVVSDTTHNEKGSLKLESQPGEDVDMDMDIEMEVEAPSPQTNDRTNLFAKPSTSVAGESVVPESEFIVPPPPEEEWIPPPPPDNEGAPPPPPVEPSESFYPPIPPSAPEALQSIYGEQYNINYAEPNMNYYGSTCSVSSGSNFYEHSLNLPIYSATTQQPVVVQNPADAVLYYGLQNGSDSAVPLADTIGSSSSQAATTPMCSDSMDVTIPTSTMPGVFLSQASSATVVSAPGTVSDKKHASAETAAMDSDTFGGVSEAPSAVSKAHSKATRMKKPKVSVGSSLRSNKKVSGLVDKWKAAKEELEEEERYESPSEILEKKRQRQIEEWRAQQIASGEAKENANFQPLGGNWRERVKRRRAQKGEATGTPSDPNTEGVKQPDLKALSKDLPNGWQVYWDESSKQTYYSNSITSETTWTRPTR